MSLVPIVGAPKIRHITTFDLEWVPARDIAKLPPGEKWRGPIYSEPLTLRLCGVYDEVDGYRYYDTIADFLEGELTSKNRGRWFYAHAGGLADMEFVFDELIKHIEDGAYKYYKLKAAFSGSAAIIVKVIRGKSTWTFVDSFWLLREKLANIGDQLGMAKLAAEKRKTRTETKAFFTNATMDELIPYNKQDCVILHTAISKFQETLNKIDGQLQMTIASTGMNLFKRKFLKHEIPTSEVINKFAEKAYFASRVEVFNAVAKKFFIYDINSSFPHAMTSPCPGQFIARRKSLPTKDGAMYLADVEIEIPDMYLPPIPVKMNGRLFFPTGRWRTWLSTIDLELLLRTGGRIIKAFDVLEFARCDDLRDYALTIYAMRMKTKIPFEKVVYKYLLNSLYGKFAEGMTKSTVMLHPDKIDRDDPDWRMLMPGVWQVDREAKISHRHVPMSVWITAIARRTLYDGLEAALKAGEPVHYCDTDSVATPAHLPTSDELGGFKLEKKMLWARFAAPKVYQGEGFELKKDGSWDPIWLNRAKGFSLQSSGKEAVAELTDIIEGKEIFVQRMARLRELFSRGDSTPAEILVRKALTGQNVPKRFHFRDGSTRPWSHAELTEKFDEEDT